MGQTLFAVQALWNASPGHAIIRPDVGRSDHLPLFGSSRLTCEVGSGERKHMHPCRQAAP